MKVSSFKAGQRIQQFNYKSFEPNQVDLPWEVDDAKLTLLLSQADIKLGELNAYSQLIPDIDFFIKMHVLKEGAIARFLLFLNLLNRFLIHFNSRLCSRWNTFVRVRGLNLS
jgi:hypothetical protein